MASNRKEVDLVIRAKDQAAGAVEAVTKAIEDFIGSQKGLQAEGAKTDSTITKIGASFTELTKALGGSSALSAVERQLTSAREAMDRLNKATAEAAGEAIGYQREALQAARATEQLRIESEQVAKAVERQAAAVKLARDAEAKLQGITKAATADRAKLVAADKKLTDQIEQQRLKLVLATAALRDLDAETKAATAPTEKLQAQMASVAREVRKAEEALTELQTTQAVVRQSIDATARSVEQANTKYGGTAAGLKAQEAALTSLEAKQKDLASSVTVAANSQAKLEAGARKAAAGLLSNERALEASADAYRQVEAEAARMDGALSKLEQRARGPLLSAFGKQAETVSKLKTEFAEYQAEATRLGRAIAATKSPSDAMVAAFTNAQESAARTRQAYRSQNEELAVMRRILRESGGDVSDFADRQERFAAVVTRANKGFKEFASDSEKAAAAARKNADAAERAKEAAEKLSQGNRKAGDAARKAASDTSTFAGALRAFYGESRQALSFTQRLRSEVLSLIAAYGGFYAVIGGVRNVVEAYQTLEAAQSRLNVVFDGNQAQTAEELDFIRRNAERLGIEFGTLAGEYGKFAVATKNTNLQGEATRKIFISVAEAARVNKLSLDDTKGVFVALTQIVSKGRVSMEELRQQLGDRLPGAIQIMADAAGVGTDELFKMIEQGQLSSDVLSKFAEELDKRFGSQLPKALETTTTALGQLKNAIFQAFLKVANGGFIEKFTALVKDLTATLESAQFESFLDRLSVALGTAADALAFLARNFDLVVISVTAFLGLKIAPFVVLLASRLGILTGATVSTTRGFRAMYVAVSTGAVTMSRGAIAVRGLTIALRGLLSSTGIGLAVVAIGAAIGAWVSSTEKATEALSTHRELVDQLKDAYDKVGGSVENMGEALKNISVQEARRNLLDLEKAFEDTAGKFNDARRLDGASAWTTFFGTNLASGASKEFEAEVDAVIAKVNNGQIAFTELRSELDKVSEKYRDGSDANRRFADALDIAAKDVVEQAKAIQEARDVVTVLTGSSEDAAAAWKRLTGTVEDGAGPIQDTTKDLEAWGKALHDLQGLVPGLQDDLEILDEKAKLKNALDAALKLARTYGQVVQALDLYQQGLDAIEGRQALQAFDGSSGGAIGDAAQLIRQFEGFRSTPYYDVNAYRAGYGSDTVTLSDGTIQKVTQGMRVSVEDANRDLVRRIAEFQNVVKGQIGETRFNNFNEQQQAVLTSIAYNYGSLPDRILEAVRGGTSEEISAAIRGLANDNNGINANRRNQEATIFSAAGPVSDKGTIAAEEERLKLLEKQTEERQKQAEATAETIQQGQFDLAQQELINAGKEREAAIQAAINAAKKENPNISAADLEIIRQQTAALYDQQHIGEDRKKQLEEAEKAEQRVNDLIEARTALQEQLTAALAAGQGANVTAPLRDGITQINGQLQDAIANAVKLYQALGLSDPAIQAAVAKLQTLSITSATTASRVVIDWRQVEQQFASGMVSAFDRFSQAVAEGQSVTEAARDAFLQFAADFLRQIAQMILQQLALNAAKAIFGGFGVGVAHTGGVVGASGARRTVDPAVFANAMRYHSGGIAGLRPGEVPTILQRGEEVLTQNDPRHIFNAGKGGSSGSEGKTPRIVNAFDGTSFLEQALKTREGEELILNHVSANPAAFRAALGV